MTVKGLRQFLDAEQQRAWLEGETDAAGRRRALRRNRSNSASNIRPVREAAPPPAGAGRPRHPPPLRRNLHPHPARDRALLLVGLLPALDPDKPLARVNASWMELFTLLAGRRSASAPASSSISPISPPTDRPSPTISTPPSSKAAPSGPKTSAMRSGERQGHPHRQGPRRRLDPQVPRNPRALRAIRSFNLTHMNRGRNAYQASHCYSLADAMLDELPPSAATPA